MKYNRLAIPLFALLLLLSPLTASAALAVGAAELQKCASIPKDSDRLLCYDSLSRKLGIPTASSDGTISTTQASYGKWILRNEGNSAEGSPSVFAFTFSEKTLPRGSGAKPVMAVRCYQGVTELFIEIPPAGSSREAGENPNLYVLPSQEKSTGDKGIIVIGEEPAQAGKSLAKARLTQGNGKNVDMQLKPSADQTAWFLPNPVSFIGQIKNSAKVTIEGLSGMPSGKMVFDMEGFTDALTPLRNSCSW
ncbi:hypothetical protein EPN96_06480 [bacterium]|nr:MAG: hypothetical protein EPN96_06480 [bacterium]